jgi:hydrogenase nickel incorporation protein HypA/HybF
VKTASLPLVSRIIFPGMTGINAQRNGTPPHPGVGGIRTVSFTLSGRGNEVHEYSIVRALLDRVEAEVRARGAVSVAAVRVALGRQSGVEPGLLRSAFELVRAGTPCAAAELELAEIDTRWACRTCGAETAAERPSRCASCGGPTRLVAGDEIVLERLELEVA